MKINKALKVIFLLLILFLMIGCSNSEKKDDHNKSHQKVYKNLNLTILIDLSDRISEKKNPGQVKNDLKLINSILMLFKNYLTQKGVVNSEDKIKVIYYPQINNDSLNSIIDSLNIDFSDMLFNQRKRIFNLLEVIFNQNLTKVYNLASRMPEYPGSDLFNYFKHRIVDDCIIDDNNYLNILVILTDGYIYHENAKYRKGNRFSYLGPKANQVAIFRNHPNWEKIFDEQDYGLINTEAELSNLYIIAAQFNPISFSPQDFDIMKKYWSKWFEEQKLKKGNYKILRNDNPILNISIIQKFFNKIIMDNTLH
ncbi:MAG: hypothetical protein ACPL25_05960 [Ignavibacteria bacterium]